MLASTAENRQAVADQQQTDKPLTWQTPPWDRHHQSWLEIDAILGLQHPARLIDALVDALDLTDLRASYRGTGSAPFDPALLLKVVLAEIHRGEHSPAGWFQDTREWLPLQWLTFGAKPARTAFYDFRCRLGADFLKELNKQVGSAAVSEGHAKAKRSAVDGTFTAALGSRHHLLNEKSLDKRCAELDAAIAQDEAQTACAAATILAEAAEPAPAVAIDKAPSPAESAASALCCGAAVVEVAPPAALAENAAVVPGGDAAAPSADASQSNAAVPEAVKAPPRPRWQARSKAGRKLQRKLYGEAKIRLKERQRHHAKAQQRKPKAKRCGGERVVVCPTEPEAAIGRDKHKVYRPLYNTQLNGDVDSPFILGYGVYAETTDVGLLDPLLTETEQMCGVVPEIVLGDGHYVSALDLAACAAKNIVLYGPVSGASVPAQKAKKENKTIAKEEFAWLAEKQTYRCPQGHLLEVSSKWKEGRQGGAARVAEDGKRETKRQELVVIQYRCAGEHCQACPEQERCTSNPQKGRTIKRHEHQDFVDQLQARMSTPQGKALYKKRASTVERLFADVKEHRGLRRFYSRGLEQARTQVGLLVLLHNGLALVKARRRVAVKAIDGEPTPS
jgi:DDE family transposase